MTEYIQVQNEAEESVSFAFGDEVRQSLIYPWRLPFLPFTLAHRIINLRIDKRKTKVTQSTDCLFIFDLEKMRRKDQKSFVKEALNFAENTISLGIGKPSIEMKFNHTIPSRSEWGIEPKHWNSSVESLLLGLIRTYHPKKLVFVGKYPYAGIMGALRRCNSSENMYWISVRGDPLTIQERSERFSKVKNLEHFTDFDSIIKNTIFFDRESLKTEKKLAEIIEKSGLNIIKNPTSAADIIGMLSSNQTVMYPSELVLIKNKAIPPYAVSNLIHIEKGYERFTLEKLFKYRKNRKSHPSAIMSVQARLDIWFNSREGN
jgi:hypothetical protein